MRRVRREQDAGKLTEESDTNQETEEVRRKNRQVVEDAPRKDEKGRRVSVGSRSTTRRVKGETSKIVLTTTTYRREEPRCRG